VAEGPVEVGDIVGAPFTVGGVDQWYAGKVRTPPVPRIREP